jgi:hypothetical protein
MPKNDDGVPCTVRTEVNPEYLRGHENPLNWKDHTKRQKGYAESSIEEHGWARQLLYCANTDRLIDGHGRLKISLKKQYKSVPIDVGWWTKDQGDVLLASLDTMSNMASVNANALASLTESILKKKLSGKNGTPSPVTGNIRDVHAFARQIQEDVRDKISIRQSKISEGRMKRILENKEKKSSPSIDSSDPNLSESASEDHREMFYTELRSDLIFPSRNNKIGLPDLLPDKLYTNTKKLPTKTFDRSGKSLNSMSYYDQGSRPFDSFNHLKPQGGFLGFFCEDDKFVKYFNKAAYWAENLIDEKWTAIIEPDFSAYWDWPYPVRLWSIYRARWCCRYWQQLGMKIIPLLHRTNNFKTDSWIYSSLPEKTPIMCMQLRMGGRKLSKDPQYWNNIGKVLQLAADKHGLEFILFHAVPDYEKYIIERSQLD